MKQKEKYIKLVLCVFASVCLSIFVKKLYDSKMLDERLDETERLIEQRENELESLRKKYEMPVDDEYILNEARQRFEYSFPDEIIYENDVNK